MGLDRVARELAAIGPVRLRARRAGVGGGPPWRPEELEVLRAEYPVGGAGRVRALLRTRTLPAIVAKAVDLDLRAPKWTRGGRRAREGNVQICGYLYIQRPRARMVWRRNPRSGCGYTLAATAGTAWRKRQGTEGARLMGDRDREIAKMEQLLAFVDWELQNHPPVTGRHIVEWAAEELEKAWLRETVLARTVLTLEKVVAERRCPKCGDVALNPDAPPIATATVE